MMMDKPVLEQNQLEIITLRNEGKTNPEICAILGKSKNSIGKAITKINKISPSAIKVGMSIPHTHESKYLKAKADNLAIEAEELNISVIESILRKTYPKLFNDERLPLTIGTNKVIIETGLLVDFTDLAKKTFFRRWVRTIEYSKACLLHKYRFDVDGNKVDKILPQHLALPESIVKRDKKNQINE